MKTSLPRTALWCLASCLLCMWSPGTLAKEAAYKTAEAGAWVVPVSPLHAAAAKAPSPRGGVAYLLQDYQTRVDQRSKTSYVHTAKQALDGAGVQNVANISISFDPSYQRLTLHAINVIRAGAILPRLPGADVHLLQREKELEYLIYDGSMTASVVLDDVRIGDIVEYAYSVEGNNPVFQNKVTGKADLEWSVPVEHAFVRLLLPADRPIQITLRNSKLQPKLSEAGGYRDYRWELRDIAELRPDSGAPAWYEPYASVRWSEFQDWAAVVQWASPLYQPQRDMSPTLRQEIARIAQMHPEPAQRIAAVLKLVQREIRYMGIEVGAGSHAPTAPSIVFQRRFGDCKDKALLMVTMLDALGLEAAPALVNTVATRDLVNWEPTPAAFNHVMVRVRLDGKVYWLDPTRAVQQGDLRHLYQPDYGYTLVLEPGARGLTAMPSAQSNQRTVHTLFDASAGIAKPVSFTVTSTVLGSGADGLREQLAGNKADLTTQYQNFYARRYARIRTDEPLQIRDDAVANALTLVESYQIPGFWERSGKPGRLEASIEASEIMAPLKAPDAISRNAPLRLDYPNDITEETEVRLPSSWTLKQRRTAVSDPAFEFSYEVLPQADNKSVLIRATYRALRDHVAPGDMGSYVAHLKTARESLGYQLSTNDDGAPFAGESAESNSARSGQWTALLMVAGVLLLIWRPVAARWRAAAPEHHEVNQRLALALLPPVATAVLILLPAVSLEFSLSASAVIWALLSRYMWRTVSMVPATHIAYGWAQRCYRLGNDELLIFWLSLARKLPPLIGWCVIGGFVAKLLA